MLRRAIYAPLALAIFGALTYWYYYGWKPKGELTMGRVRRMEIYLSILGVAIFFAIIGLMHFALGLLLSR
jgi:hypothetical protein